MMRAIIFAMAAGAVLLGQVGCALTDVDLGDSATRQMLSLLMPAEIIVEPFTGLKSFDDDDLPDGIEVVMRPVDAFGDPVKIAGHLIIEVHQFRRDERSNSGTSSWPRPATSRHTGTG